MSGRSGGWPTLVAAWLVAGALASGLPVAGTSASESAFAHPGPPQATSGARQGPAWNLVPVGPPVSSPAPQPAAPILPPTGEPPTTGAPAAISLETPGVNERVSVGPEGEELKGQNVTPAISDDGNRVVFTYFLVIDSRVRSAIVLRDRSGGTSTLVYPPSLDDRKLVASGLSVAEPDISGDGNWVAFEAGNGKNNLIGMWSAERGVFDPLVEAKQRFSWAVNPKLSRDGRYLAFIGQTAATTTASQPGYFVLDREQSRVYPVGFDEAGNRLIANQYLGDIDISGDGGWVAYADVPFRDQTGQRQVWRRAVGDASAELVSAGRNGGRGNADSSAPAINEDGTVVAFASDATNLVAGDTNDRSDVFRLARGRLQRVSQRINGGQANGGSTDPALNGRGSMIAFASWATNLVPDDTTGPVDPGLDRSPDYDIFLLDAATERLSRVNVGVGTKQANATSNSPALSASGREVTYSSEATNLIQSDTNEYEDVFLRTRLPSFRVAADPTDFGSTAVQSPPGVARTATVTSTGAWPVVITGSTISGSGIDSYFISNDQCRDRTLAPGDRCTIEITFVPDKPGKATATLSVTARTIARARTIRLTGEGGAGSIRINPRMGPPGTVVTVTGRGFGVGLPVTMTWSRGITTQILEPVITNDKGTFTAQVLVLPRDRPGARKLQAIVNLVTGDGLKADAQFTVTTATGVPPMMGLVQVFRDQSGRTIVLRR